MTSSARASSDGGIVRPRAFAVLRLITSSNFVGCSTGRSAGLAPLQNLVHVDGEASWHLSLVLSVCHEAAIEGIGPVHIYCRQPLSGREVEDLSPVDPCDGHVGHVECAEALLADCDESLANDDGAPMSRDAAVLVRRSVLAQPDLG